MRVSRSRRVAVCPHQPTSATARQPRMSLRWSSFD